MSRAQFTEKTVRFGEVAWPVAMNISRGGNRVDAKTNKSTELDRSMYEKGWVSGPEHSAIAVPIGLIEKSLVAAEIERRLAEIQKSEQALKADPASARNAAEVRIYREAWLEQDGTPIQPKYFGVTANCRQAAYLRAMINRASGFRYDDFDGEIPEEIVWEIPVSFTKPATLDDAIEIQCMENGIKDVGFTKPSPVQNLISAKWFVGRGANQSRLRKMYTPSEGQRIWNVLSLDTLFPGLHIYDRCTKPQATLDKLQFGESFNLSRLTADLVEVRRRSNPVELAELNALRKKKNEEPFTQLSADEVEEILTEMSAKPTSRNSMSPKKLKEFAGEVGANPIASAALDPVQTGDKSELYKITGTALACTAILRLYDVLSEDDWTAFQTALERLADNPVAVADIVGPALQLPKLTVSNEDSESSVEETEEVEA